MSKLVTAAVGAAAIASSNAQCSAPAPLANVVIQPCGTTGASQSWNFTGTSGLGQFVLKGTSPALCMAEYGTGESGTANVAVKTCDVTDRSQLWSFYLPNQPPTWVSVCVRICRSIIRAVSVQSLISQRSHFHVTADAQSTVRNLNSHAASDLLDADLQR